MQERYEIEFIQGGVGIAETLLTAGLANVVEKSLDTLSGDDNHGWHCTITDNQTGIKVTRWGVSKGEAQEKAFHILKGEVESFEVKQQKELEEANYRQQLRQREQQRTPVSSSEDNVVVGFLVKMVVYLLIAAAILWFVFAVAIPLIIIDIALIALITGLVKKEWNKYLFPLSFIGTIYIVLDYNNGLLTKSLVTSVPFLKDLIPILLYINIAAGLIAVYFIVRDLLNKKNPSKENEGEFSKRNMIIMGCLLLVGGLTIGLQKYYDAHSSPPTQISVVTSITDPIGEWTGNFGERQIIVVIERIDNSFASGYNILNGKRRSIAGTMTKTDNSYTFELKEPGDDKWDGIFYFIVANGKLEGTWKSNNGRLTRTFILNKDSKTILANNISNDVNKNSNGTNNRVNDQNFYILNVAAVKTEEIAKAKVNELRGKGKDAGYLWIPDYASLSGAKLYSIYIGPFSTQRECEIATEEYRKIHPDAYGLLVSQDHKRIQINGIGKIVVKPN